jgi:hypothetical protein
MKTYKMTRVYETYIEVEDGQELGQEIYAMELEQCNVVDEKIELVYARKCSVTGEGMNEGWYADGCGMYFANESDALHWCIDNGYRDIDDAYADDAIYWTEWEGDE